MTPVVLPDLYRGEPVALTARMGALSGTLEIKGLIGDRPWLVTLPLENAAQGSGLSKLWARRKITDAEVARTLRTITPEEADQRILALALDHHLVSRLTSLVAVDKTPSRPEGARLTQAEFRSTSRPAGNSTRCSGRNAMRRPILRSRRSSVAPISPRPRRHSAWPTRRSLKLAPRSPLHHPQPVRRCRRLQPMPRSASSLGSCFVS